MQFICGCAAAGHANVHDGVAPLDADGVRRATRVTCNTGELDHHRCARHSDRFLDAERKWLVEWRRRTGNVRAAANGNSANQQRKSTHSSPPKQRSYHAVTSQGAAEIQPATRRVTD